MAIKIKPGMSPQFGRITMPKGTFLSNPSTAADGGLGGGGTTPATPTIGANPSPQGYDPIGDALKKWWASLPGTQAANKPPQMYNALGQPITGFQQTNTFGNQTEVMTTLNATDFAGNPYTYNPQTGHYDRNATSMFKPITPSSPSNSLVGSTLLSSPNQITQHQIDAMFGGMSQAEVAKTMGLKGYVATYQAGVGQIWVKVAESAPSGQLSGANNFSDGQRVDASPYQVGPTLAPGQRVVTAGYKSPAGTTLGSGVGVTGGTPYTDKNGNTVAQYAVSYGQGGDRWKFKISQDQEGNWVRTYYRTYSKARTRSALKKKQGRAERAAQQAQATDMTAGRQGDQTAPTGYDQQLVTLRASYG